MRHTLLVLAAFAAGCASTQPVRPAVTDTATTVRYAALVWGNPDGEQVTTIRGNERRHHFQYNDRGRGPNLDSVVTLDDRGLPIRVTITGTDYYKNAITEVFQEMDGKATWKSSSEQGEAAGTGAFYSSINGTPAEMATLVRAVLATSGKCLALYPSGEACIDRLQDLQAGDQTITQYAVSGLGFEPVHVWLDARQELFATVSTYLSVIREGHEALAGKLVRLDEDQVTLRRARLTTELRHRRTRPLVIRNARVFDPKTLAVQDGMVVIVEGNRILGVEHDADVTPPPGAEIIDAAGKMLLPGLWDMHFHLAGSEGVLTLAAGVTGVRILGANFETIQRTKKEWDGGLVLGPRVVIRGFVDGSGPFSVSELTADNEEQAREAIDKFSGAGFEGIKIYSSIKPELVPFLIRYAHEKGLRISGHIPAGMFAEDLVRMGFDEIHHANMLFLNFYKDVKDTRTPLRFTAVGDRGADLDLQSSEVRGLIALLKEKNVVVDPTLGVFQGLFLGRPGTPAPALAAVAERLPISVQRAIRTGGLPVDAAKDVRYRAAFRRMQDLVVELWRQGITLVPGTDNIGGFPLHHELVLWVESGIPAPEVLRMATLGAARVARLDRELGSIEEGKLADMILVDGDPTKNIHDIRRVVLTIKDGDLYDPAKLYRSAGVKPVM